MTEDAALESLKSLVAAMEMQSDLQGDFLETIRLHRERLDAAERRADELEALVGRLGRTAELLCNMKAATLIVSCVRCGRRFAKEPGPELCGLCWIAAGRPGSIGLHLVSTNPTHEGSDPA